MTLLLTFFVLLLSMSSMESTVVSRISVHSMSVSPLEQSGTSKMNERIEFIIKTLRDPDNVQNKQKRIKDLLFPLENLPDGMMQSELEKNLTILSHPDGVVIVLTDALLFAPGSSTLGVGGKKLLDQLTPVMQGMKADIAITGHSSPGASDSSGAELSTPSSLDELSFLRAAVVMEHFLQAGMPPKRFSLSGYGADKPMFSNDTREGRRKNRRVEILVKCTPRLAGY
jgi:chemotaxis protein MotB